MFFSRHKRHITISCDGDATFPSSLSFKCAVTDSKGPRRTMEDAHSIIVPFGGVRGQGFFAIFDGHAGKQAAEWCGQNFSLYLLEALRKHTAANIPDVLNQTFHNVDTSLSRMTEESEGKMHAGCTAVTAFLRLEDANGKQSFIPSDFDPLQSSTDMIEADGDDSGSGGEAQDELKKKKSGKTKLKDRLRNIGGGRSDTSSLATTSSHSSSASEKDPARVFTPSSASNIRRVLYCANAGDARGVLCRGGKAVRLTYDHKGSDKQEAKRIMDAGGFVMSGRVNGVLAVTRSLGDSSMKEFVVGAPYTTETELSDEDEFLILACDGLWDVVEDQAAVQLVRDVNDPRKAAEALLDHAYKNWSSDNVTVLVVRFRNAPSTK
ncbi:protein serine/threonine phosphatase 2C [Cristinia sonorae]|uniref:Protein serine/threonine phosphatase 2C n=1 Tax=Cristinia sonorae TaxID=1940300 RepID=A0A8K0UG68_9AGAR|nr:protein serine/threonine phosphatase 2C [Cristinia sonorae]